MPDDLVPDLLARATEMLEQAFGILPTFKPARRTDGDREAIAGVLEETARLLGDNYPYFHPMYAGQMLKPPHPVARAAYALAMTINPNNHARDGGGPALPWKSRLWRRLRGCSAGQSTWGT